MPTEDFQDALKGLKNGDFTRLDPLFQGDDPQILRWLREGRFASEPAALNEALSCAAFNGRASVAKALHEGGADLEAGNGTGLSALHWAVNRGQEETAKWLIEAGASLESLSAHDGTVLDTAIWSLVNEPRDSHEAIIKDLIAAGAKVEDVKFPAGNPTVDMLLGRTAAPD